MRLPLLLATLAAPLLVSVAPAAAQSGPPGMCDCGVPVPAVVPVAPAQEAEPWQQQRWGLGLRVGSLGLAEGDYEETYGTAGLAARYRMSRRWELELALEGGQQQLEDGSAGDRELSAGTLSVLLHLTPQSRWDWYLLAGLGSSERHLSGDPNPGDERGHLALGGGLEYRFDHLVLGVDVRVLAQEADTSEAIAASRVSSPGAKTEQLDAGGGQVTLTGGWYF